MSGKEGCSSDQKHSGSRAGKKDRNKGRNKTEIKKQKQKNATKTETKAETKTEIKAEMKRKVLKRTGKKECNMLSEAMERFIKEHEKEAYDLLLTIAASLPHLIMRKKSPVLL